MNTKDDTKDESMGFTKTMMTYSEGELVIYGNKPHLIKNYDPVTQRLTLSKVGGGHRRVRAINVTPIEGLTTRYSELTEVPFEILNSFYPGELFNVVGSGFSITQTLLNKSDFSLQTIRLKPIGKSAKNLYKDLKLEFEDTLFKSKILKLQNPTQAQEVVTLLLVTYSKPSPNNGYLKKYYSEFTKHPSIIIYVSDSSPPQGYSSYTNVGELLSGFLRPKIIQVKNIAEMTREQKSLIVGLARVGCKIKQKLDIPR